MATPPSLTLSYQLFPPDGVTPPPSLPPIATHEFQVKVERTAKEREFYAGLQDAVETARGVFGLELTAWRNAVMGAELEPVKDKRESDEEEEEQEDEYNDEDDEKDEREQREREEEHRRGEK